MTKPTKPKAPKPSKPILPGQKQGQHGRPVPLSENERKFHQNWTKDDCIAELRRIAEADPAPSDVYVLPAPQPAPAVLPVAADPAT